MTGLAALAAAGWLLVLATGWRSFSLVRRLELVADAEHELRGPLAALTLAAARARSLEPQLVEGQLERARVALADLAAAQTGRRAAAEVGRHAIGPLTERAAAAWRAAGGGVSVDWRAGDARVDADHRRVSQALGNLLANALEHGAGTAEVRALRSGRKLRIEVTDRGTGPGSRGSGRRRHPGAGGRRRRFGTRGRHRLRTRGRGLAIAAQAVEEAGGRLSLTSGPHGAVAAVELPLAEP